MSGNENESENQSKSQSTKNKIIDVSMSLFSDKGYQAVTMKDICEKSELSRGGVYRYFASTKEVFLAMLDREIDGATLDINKGIANKVSALKMFEVYLENEKNLIFSNLQGLFHATHEFAFVETEYRGYFDNRVSLSVELVKKILSYGQANGEFKSFDSLVMATHIIYLFDGIKTSAAVLSITEEMVDSQLKLIREMIIWKLPCLMVVLKGIKVIQTF